MLSEGLSVFYSPRNSFSNFGFNPPRTNCAKKTLSSLTVLQLTHSGSNRMFSPQTNQITFEDHQASRSSGAPVIELENNAVNSNDFFSGPYNSQSRKATSSYSSKVKILLPAVSKSSLHALLNENEFVDLNGLFPKNRTPRHRTSEKSIVFDATLTSWKRGRKRAKKT